MEDKKAYLILILLALNIFNSSQIVKAPSCENINLDSQQYTINTNGLYICDIYLKNNAQLIINNSSNITISGMVQANNNSKIVINNSEINFKNNITLYKSSLILNNTKLNVDYGIQFKSFNKSEIILTNSSISSNNFEMVLNESSLNSSLVAFYGKIRITPLSSSNLSIRSSSGFDLILYDQGINAFINSSTFSISLAINFGNSVSIQIPHGYFKYWNSTLLKPQYFQNNRIEVFNSYINPPELNSEILLLNKGNYTIYDSVNLIISIFDINSKITNLSTGYFLKKNFILSNETFINLINTEIKKWRLYFSKIKDVYLANSSNIDIYIDDNVGLKAYNVRLIGLIYAKGNSKLMLNKSSIVDKVILRNNAKIIAVDSSISDLNNIIVFNNASAYFSSIDKIQYTSKSNITAFDLYGTVAVIAANNSTYLKFFKITIAPVTKYPKAYTALIGFENRNGLIATFYLNNLPNGLYNISLEVSASNNFNLVSSLTIKINTGINPQPPQAPSLIASVSGYPSLSWIDNNPFYIPVLGYNIYRGESPNSLKKIATAEGNIYSYIDTSASKDVQYYYAITAFNEYGESNFSNIIPVKVPSKTSYKELFLIYEWIPALGLIAIIMFLIGLIITRSKNKKQSIS
jgi:hypothetical protein